jgi:hypothetical protein
MTKHPITLAEIVGWYRSKQRSLQDSGISVTAARERRRHLPGAAAEFTCKKAMGRINGLVSGEFEFEVVRVSDGKDLLRRHISVSTVDALEATYIDFLQYLLNQNKPGNGS